MFTHFELCVSKFKFLILEVRTSTLPGINLNVELLVSFH